MFHKIALLLVILGATNVGMTSWLHVDVIGTLFGPISPMVNVLVGLSGVYMLLTTYTTLIKKPA
ncbi:MAG: DUF378 domain-containing protein [Alphaproteobacteria bacterium]|nr:DUF378 domain-containing protein [Alphaproteobacteria bacterium]